MVRCLGGATAATETDCGLERLRDGGCAPCALDRPVAAAAPAVLPAALALLEEPPAAPPASHSPLRISICKLTGSSSSTLSSTSFGSMCQCVPSGSDSATPSIDGGGTARPGGEGWVCIDAMGCAAPARSTPVQVAAGE